MTWKLPQGEKLRVFLSQYRYVLLMLVVGVILLILPTGDGETGEIASLDTGQTATTDTAEAVETLELRLSQVLSQIAGVGDVQVILTLADNGQQVYAQDEKDGSSSHVVVTSGGEDMVVTVQSVTATFRGALVVCQGGDSPQVRLSITTAISALTGLSSDKIAICTAE